MAKQVKVCVHSQDNYDQLVALCNWYNQMGELKLLHVHTRPLPDKFYERVLDAKLNALHMVDGGVVMDIDVTANAADGSTSLIATCLDSDDKEVVVDITIGW